MKRHAVTLRCVLGQMLAARRKELDVAQDALARKLAVSPATLSKIETGSQDISVEQLWLLAHLLKTSPSALLERTESVVRALKRLATDTITGRSRRKADITARTLAGHMIAAFSQAGAR